MYNEYAEILWDYHHMYQMPKIADCILVFGSHDLHVAERAAQLYLEGYSELVILTGGLGRVTRKIWGIPEAQKFREIALLMGVPSDNILVECDSTNTGQNIINAWKLIKERNLNINSFIIVDKPYKERRAYATFNKQWPNPVENSITSPQFTFKEYCDFYSSGEISVHEFISIMVGDLQRIDAYGKNGYQIVQKIPEKVWHAYNKLVEMGFTEHLIKN